MKEDYENAEWMKSRNIETKGQQGKSSLYRKGANEVGILHGQISKFHCTACGQ